MKRVDLSRSVAEIAVMERRKQGLKLSDAIILASADSEGCILVTRNTRDYDAHDPRVRFPYSLLTGHEGCLLPGVRNKKTRTDCNPGHGTVAAFRPWRGSQALGSASPGVG